MICKHLFSSSQLLWGNWGLWDTDVIFPDSQKLLRGGARTSKLATEPKPVWFQSRLGWWSRATFCLTRWAWWTVPAWGKLRLLSSLVFSKTAKSKGIPLIFPRARRTILFQWSYEELPSQLVPSDPKPMFFGHHQADSQLLEKQLKAWVKTPHVLLKDLPCNTVYNKRL